MPTKQNTPNMLITNTITNNYIAKHWFGKLNVRNIGLSCNAVCDAFSSERTSIRVPHCPSSDSKFNGSEVAPHTEVISSRVAVETTVSAPRSTQSPSGSRKTSICPCPILKSRWPAEFSSRHHCASLVPPTVATANSALGQPARREQLPGRTRRTKSRRIPQCLLDVRHDFVLLSLMPKPEWHTCNHTAERSLQYKCSCVAHKVRVTFRARL